MTVITEVIELTGTLFKSNYFRYEQTIDVQLTTKEIGEKAYYEEYSFMFRIGEAFCMNFVFLQKEVDSKILPKYIIHFYPHAIDHDEYYTYFVDSLLELNAFMKEMQPMIDTAKYLQDQYNKEDE
jgi:hypothetical protein